MMDKKPNRSFRSETRKYALLGALFGFMFPILATLIRISSSIMPLSWASLVATQINDPLLWIIDTAPLFLGIFAGIAGYRQDIVLETNRQLKERENELVAAQSNLEKRVEERTAELVLAKNQITRRAEYLHAVAEVSRAIASIQDQDKLLNAITSLISQQFNVYHTGIFLIDDQNQYAILRAANTDGGLKMLLRGHKLLVGQQGIVGYAARSGQPRIALDVGLDAAFFNNPDLPMTHSELALPLKVREVIFGVLDLQSTETNAFNEEDVSVLSILSDQIALAIQNVRAMEQTQLALQEAQASSKTAIQEAWKEFGISLQIKGFRFDGIKPEPLKDASPSMPSKHVVSIPVRLRGQTIGNLKLKGADSKRPWTDDELAMAEATAERVALALESARLLAEAQKRAERETFLSEISTKLSASFRIDNILRDTVEELGQALKGSTVTFQLVNPSTLSSSEKPPKSNGASKQRKKTE